MKTLIQIKTLLGMLALAALVPCSVDAQSRTDEGSSGLTAADVSLTANVDSLLSRASQLNQLGQLDLAELSQLATVRESRADAQMLVQLDMTRVTNSADEISESLLSSGLDIELVRSQDPDRVRAWVGVSRIDGLISAVAEISADIEVTAYINPVANFGEYESEGTGAMLADLYHAAGAQGDGVTIALFDIGFQGLDDMAREIGLSEDSLQSGLQHIQGYENDESSHGTAMLEVLRDTAPGAELRPYRLDETLDVYTATLDAINSGADIIVCPLSWFELPGEGAASDAAQLALDNGVMWVNAGGNFSDGAYWEGNDPLWAYNGETYISFVDGQLVPQQRIQGVQAGDVIRVHLAYELPRFSSLELALEIHSWDGVSPDMNLVASGTPGMQHQTVSALVPADANLEYYAMVRVTNADMQGRMRMFLEDASHSFEHSVAEGAIANPAALDGVLAVAAMPVDNYAGGIGVEPQSSQGGGLFDLSVDLCGPSMLTTGTYGPQGFAGTSCASASIGGLLALQLGDKGLAQDPLGNLNYIESDPNKTGAGCVMGLVDAAEFDGDQDSATDIGNSSVSIAGHSLSPSTDTDMFRFEVLSSQSLEIAIDSQAGLELIAQDTGDSQKSDDGGIYDALIEPGVYFIRVVGQGEQLVESYNLTVNLFVGPPSAVELLSPQNGESITHEDKMAWTESESALPVIYHVEIAADEAFGKIVKVSSTGKNAMELPKIEYGKYFWRVQAVNSNGDASGYSEAGAFAVEPPQVSEPEEEPEGVIGEPVSATVADGDDEASGCVSGHSTSSMIFLVLAILGSIAGIRAHSKRKEA